MKNLRERKQIREFVWPLGGGSESVRNKEQSGQSGVFLHSNQGCVFTKTALTKPLLHNEDVSHPKLSTEAL